MVMDRIRLILRLYCCMCCVLGMAAFLRGEEPPDAKLQKLADDSRSRGGHPSECGGQRPDHESDAPPERAHEIYRCSAADRHGDLVGLADRRPPRGAGKGGGLSAEGRGTVVVLLRIHLDRTGGGPMAER